jgi:flagellar biosynthesis/type III secretory pathway protein FliH
MMAVIKAGSHAPDMAVRSFFAENVTPSVVVNIEDSNDQMSVKEEDLVVDQLLDKLAQRDAQIAELEANLSASFTKGEAAGRITAEDEFQDDRTAALEVLKQSLVQAGTDYQNAITSLEKLAMLVSIEAIEKMVGNSTRYRSVLRDLIAHQVKDIDASSLVAIEVSRSDFPDTREVAALEKAFSGYRERLAVLDTLAAGECRIKLTIGALEIGIDQQWGEIKTLLKTLAGPQ